MPPVRALLELCGLRIALFNALAASAGFLVASDEYDGRLAVLVLGVAALVCGARSLNQYQERRPDALMPRTSGRPLCSGRLRPADALVFSCCCFLCGSAALLLTGSPVPPLLGLLAVAWYNGLYTNLKRHWAFAVVPGAVVGAVPPAIGWTAAGGSLADVRIWHLCFFFFMWQVPHSWVFMLRYGDEYAGAGLPSPTSVLGAGRASRVVFVWVAAAAVSSLLMAAGGVVSHTALNVAMACGSAWISISCVRLLGSCDPALYSAAFRRINLYAALVLAVVFFDRVIVS